MQGALFRRILILLTVETCIVVLKWAGKGYCRYCHQAVVGNTMQIGYSKYQLFSTYQTIHIEGMISRGPFFKRKYKSSFAVFWKLRSTLHSICTNPLFQALAKYVTSMLFHRIAIQLAQLCVRLIKSVNWKTFPISADSETLNEITMEIAYFITWWQHNNQYFRHCFIEYISGQHNASVNTLRQVISMSIKVWINVFGRLRICRRVLIQNWSRCCAINAYFLCLRFIVYPLWWEIRILCHRLF